MKMIIGNGELHYKIEEDDDTVRLWYVSWIGEVLDGNSLTAIFNKKGRIFRLSLSGSL